MKRTIAAIALIIALALTLAAPARYALAAVEEYTEYHYSTGEYRDCLRIRPNQKTDPCGPVF